MGIPWRLRKIIDFFHLEKSSKKLSFHQNVCFVKKPFMTMKIGVFWQKNWNQLFYISFWISAVLLKSAKVTVNSLFALHFILCCYELIHYLLHCTSRLKVLCRELTDSYEPYIKGQNFSRSCTFTSCHQNLICIHLRSAKLF